MDKDKRNNNFHTVSSKEDGDNSHRPFYHNADPVNYSLLKELANKNRRNMTEAESVLWKFIRRKALGETFLRQYIIGDYIVDFACLSRNVIIEVDGGYHSEPRQKGDDAIRQQWLESKGFTVYRFSNDDVQYDTFNVINKIKSIINP